MKKLFTIGFLIIGISVNAQKPDNRCRLKSDTGFQGTASLMLVDITKAKSEAGDIHKDFIIKATPAKGNTLLAITQKGTWWKGIYVKQKSDVGTTDLNLFACIKDDIKNGSNYLRTIIESYGVYIAKAEFMGNVTLYADIGNYKDLDENYNWTIEWK